MEKQVEVESYEYEIPPQMVVEDPLSEWIDVIKFYYDTNQTAYADEILFNCLVYFQNDARYYDDFRMAQLYGKYMAPVNAQELYEILDREKLGPNVAVFYEQWAFYYMYIGNFAKGAAVIKYAMNRQVQPMEALQTFYDYYRQFTIATAVIRKAEMEKNQSNQN